jgi:hypothetical protein
VCRIIIRALGAQVGWRSKNRTVNIIHAAGVKAAVEQHLKAGRTPFDVNSVDSSRCEAEEARFSGF